MAATRLPIYTALFSLLCLVASAVLGWLLFEKQREFTALTDEHNALSSNLESARTKIAEAEAILTERDTKLTELEQTLALAEENGSELLKQLEEEKERNENFESQIKKISGTVGKLDKLSKLDQELLMKYSKVYFLNEHYTPPKVAEIPAQYRFKSDEPEFVHAEVAPFLEDLLEDALEDGIELLVVSGYRSFDEQRGLKSVYTTLYGSGANAFSADQGYSEHQLGTTIDLTTKEVGGTMAGFQNTEAYTWLLGHAHRYGFILSYPDKNGYYIFEPWHWRFVGEDLADDLHDDEQFFYDVEQREIDKYLIKIFD